MAKFIRHLGIKGFLKALTFFIFSFCLLTLFIHIQTQECSSKEDGSAIISPLFGVSLQDSLSDLTVTTFIKDYADFITWDNTCPPCFDQITTNFTCPPWRDQFTQSYTWPQCFEPVTQNFTCPPCFDLFTQSFTCPPCFDFTQNFTCPPCRRWITVSDNTCLHYDFEQVLFGTVNCPPPFDIEQPYIDDPLLINQWGQFISPTWAQRCMELAATRNPAMLECSYDTYHCPH